MRTPIVAALCLGLVAREKPAPAPPKRATAARLGGLIALDGGLETPDAGR